GRHQRAAPQRRAPLLVARRQRRGGRGGRGRRRRWPSRRGPGDRARRLGTRADRALGARRGGRRQSRRRPDRVRRLPPRGAHPAGRMTIRILLGEDQSLVRGALAALLALEDDLDVVAEVARGDEVLAAVERTGPDVALLDIEMPGLDGLTVAARLRAAHPD